MELLSPTSLRDVVQQDGPLSPARAARIGPEVLAALHAAHALGIVHRDVKPANILIAPDRAVLVDFGIAQAAETSVGAATASGVRRRRRAGKATAALVGAAVEIAAAAVLDHPGQDRHQTSAPAASPAAAARAGKGHLIIKVSHGTARGLRQTARTSPAPPVAATGALPGVKAQPAKPVPPGHGAGSAKRGNGNENGASKGHKPTTG
jgi:serine/threonine protein kinase